ncbi:MAG: M20/M25/M40 family metallo-hydrolase [Chloroflexota bacterium]
MIHIDQTFLFETLKESIRINSILPYEEAYARFLAERLKSIGAEPEWDVVSTGRPNVYASAELGPSDRFMLLTGHSDTVDIADGWSTDPFEPVIKDGRLYGLGSFDMKSGLICALAAFKALLETPELHGRLGKVGFAATVDEEGYGSGAKALLNTPYARCDAILLGEPFYGNSLERPLPLGITGKVLYRIVLKGKQAHGFYPERGINAVEEAGKIVAALEQLNIGSHPEYGAGNYSTLKIDGGYQEYAIVVPERCEIIITRLTIPGENRETALKDMQDLVASLHLACEVEIETPPPFYDPYTISRATPFAQTFDSVYAQVVGQAPHYRFLQGITDANIYVAEGGIPTINFGPLGAGPHEKDEYVEIDSLVPVARVFAETTARYLMSE